MSAVVNAVVTVAGTGGGLGLLVLAVRDVARAHRTDLVGVDCLEAVEASSPFGAVPDYSRLDWAAQRVVRHEARREELRVVASRRGRVDLVVLLADPQLGRAPGAVVAGEVLAVAAGTQPRVPHRPRATTSGTPADPGVQWWRPEHWAHQQPAGQQSADQQPVDRSSVDSSLVDGLPVDSSSVRLGVAA